MLEFQKEIIKETTPHSNLLVLANGLDITTILLKQLTFYDSNKAFTFLLNLNDIELNHIRNIMPNIIFDLPSNTEKRKEMYLEGGIICISHQTLITDLVNNIIEISLISALFISQAANLKPDGTIQFILDMILSKNKDCLIRGFSENATGLNLEEALSILQVSKVFFYPRNAVIIKESLKKDTNFKEKRLKMSKEIEEIQILILEIIKGILIELKNELRHENMFYELKELIGDFELSKLNRVINLCNEILNLAGYKGKVRRLIYDVKNFKLLIGLLFSVDFGCFYEALMIFWDEQKQLKERSTWINIDAGVVLMEKCIDYKTEQAHNNDRSFKIKNKEANDNEAKMESTIKEDIKEIRMIKRKKVEENYDDDVEEKLIEIKTFKRKYKHSKIENLMDLLNTLKERILILVQSDFIKEIICKFLFNQNICLNEQLQNSVFVYTHNEFKYLDCHHENIIFLDPNLGSIRKIEILQNQQENIIKNVFLMIYKNSLEEQKYLYEIRNEKMSFEKLIDKFSRLPLSKHDNKIVLSEDEEDKKHIVLVDFREMRSTLPYYLYRSNNILKILTLETGDYILSKNTSIERKTISDFISSLSAGRLYLQTRMMTYKYKNNYLLIEFNRRPCLSDYFEPTEKINIMTKFAIFLLNFPKLKVIWSNSNLLTIKIFRKLQKREENPDLIETVIDPVLFEILLNIPGIDSFNYKRIIREFKNIKELCYSDKEKLITVVGRENAEKIYNFFNKTPE